MGFGLFDRLRPINQLRRQTPLQRQPAQQQPRLQPRREQAAGDVPPAITRDGDVPPIGGGTHDGDVPPIGGGTHEGDAPPCERAHVRRRLASEGGGYASGDASPTGGASPSEDRHAGRGENAPSPTCELPARRDRHKCPACGILLKLYNGRRMCPCGRSGAPTIDVDRSTNTMDMLDQVTGDNLGEVAYTRGLTDHPWADKLVVSAIVEACRETGILMSPSDVSSSDADRSEDADDETSSCHGFTTTSPEPDHYSDIERDPEYAVILHTIRQRQRLHDRQQRLSSTREDFRDEEEDSPDAAPQPSIQQDVLHHAPAPPPQPSASPGSSPLHFNRRSGRTKRGPPPKRGRGNRGRR